MRRILVVAACGLLAVSCAKSASPTAPMAAVPAVAAPVFADFSGVTLVTFKETTCEGLRHCFARIGATRSVELRLTQSIGAVSGVMIEGPSSTVRVSGTVSSDGEMTLTGWRPRVETYAYGFDSGRGIHTFKLRRDADGKASGTVLVMGDMDDTGRPGAVKTGGEVLAAERVQMLPVQPGFAGTWRGRSFVKSCNETLPGYCRPIELGEMSFFTLTLSSSGSIVSGSIDRLLPVTGTASGDTLVLSGDAPSPLSGGSRNTITSWNTYRDANGELRGTFTYVVTAPTYRTTYEIELYFVMLESPVTASLLK